MAERSGDEYPLQGRSCNGMYNAGCIRAERESKGTLARGLPRVFHVAVKRCHVWMAE